MIPQSLSLSLPAWCAGLVPPRAAATPEARMRFVIELARRNVEERTGGPFGAAVFDVQTRALLAVGVNVVITAKSAVAHAEVMALALALQACGAHTFPAAGRRCELVTSVAPCAMCLGAVVWSGVEALTIGARGEDAERIGFDEGDKPSDWLLGLVHRGIHVLHDVCRPDAVQVLQRYAASGGVIY